MRFDMTDGDMVHDLGGNMAMDMNGNLMQNVGGNMAMDMPTGEMHILSGQDMFGDQFLNGFNGMNGFSGGF